ncbi:MAG: cobalamin-dependent protein [Planctomycetes bacterium]|nr:cobalamin-dependent protein [Planctomycetota bacterium]
MGNPAFAASLIRTGLNGLAGSSASRLLESSTDAEAFADFEAWRVHAQTQLTELVAALEDESPTVFAARAAWSRDAFAARGQSVALLSASLEALRSVLEDSLPAHAWAVIPPYFERAALELSKPVTADACTLDPNDPAGRLARDYIAALANGDQRGAIELVLNAVTSGQLTPHLALGKVLIAAQREIGRLWHRGEWTIAEEHFASGVTRRLIERILAHAVTAEQTGKTVVVTSVSGDAHDLGVHVVSAFFELAGWRSICLGANTPVDDLVRIVTRFDVDLVALGATLDTQRKTAQTMVAALKNVRPHVRVIVGGSAFRDEPATWQRIGADAFAASPQAAVDLANQLTS